jgi:two-component system LytT family sensor kinase
MRRPVATTLLVFSAWTALAVFFGISTSLTYISQDRPGLWSRTITIELAQWWIWAAFTLPVFWVSRRFPFARGRIVSSLAVHLPLGAALALLTVTVEDLMRVWWFSVKPFLLINNLALHFLIYWALVALAHALGHYGRSRARAADMEARLRQAQVQLLRTQLQPHFLFNALNTIAELIHEDPERADQMIGRLSDLLRATLDVGNRPKVTVAEEIDLVRHYLAIQQARFGDRLAVSIEVPVDCEAALVPHLCLQPLIENAVRHGLAPRAEGGTLGVAVSRHAGELLLTVEDDGVGWSDGVPVEGIGLGNTRARLQSLYGDAGALTMSRRSGGGTVVRVVLPFSDRRGGSQPW